MNTLRRGVFTLIEVLIVVIVIVVLAAVVVPNVVGAVSQSRVNSQNANGDRL